MRPLHMLLALLTTMLWGFNFVVVKMGVGVVPPLFLTALRYIFSAFPLIFFIRRPSIGWTPLMSYGVAMGVGQFGLLFTSIQLGMPAGLASLVLQSQAFFTMGLAAMVIGERAGPVRIFGALVAFSGLGVIAMERMQADMAVIPLFMCIGAAFFWATGNIINRRIVGTYDPLGFIVWSSVFPIIPLLLLSVTLEGPDAMLAAVAAPNWISVGSVAYLVIASTLIGYGIWSFLLMRYPAGQVAPFSLLVPLFGLSSAAFVLGERISHMETIGAVLVVLGLALNVFGPRLLQRLRTN
ncbi:MAG: EamA family transporter [Proteobacteria bacterium]|nr:EamA family transporter [Pseudomonadota bacterium]